MPDDPPTGHGSHRTPIDARPVPLPALATLSQDQAGAVEKIATSGRVIDVLVGPAGKSTTMAGLRARWESSFGPGSVIGLARSAAASDVLGDELGIATENTAKWLTEPANSPNDSSSSTKHPWPNP